MVCANVMAIGAYQYIKKWVDLESKDTFMLPVLILDVVAGQFFWDDSHLYLAAWRDFYRKAREVYSRKRSRGVVS